MSSRNWSWYWERVISKQVNGFGEIKSSKISILDEACNSNGKGVS